MSDEHDADSGPDFSEGADLGAPIKPKGSGGIKAILGIVKWIGIGLGAVIFIVVIVVVTVSILNKQSKPLSEVPTSESYQAATPIWASVSTIDEVQTQTIDKEPWSVVVKINLGVDAEDKEVSVEITERKFQIQDMLRSFFSLKRAEELGPSQEAGIKAELLNRINSMLNKPAIKEILFEKYRIIQM